MAKDEMKTIPMLDLKREYAYMKADIDAAIRKCLDHQKWILGPEVSELEERIVNYLGVKYAIGTSSGTDALVLSLRALALKTKGQEYFDRSDLIITTPFTFTATGDAILRAGATPLFVDIDPVTYNLDPAQIRASLKSFSHYLSPNTHYPSSSIVGILPVHLYGQSCQMDEILAIAADYNLFIVEDCAQAFGASWRERKLGTIGICGAFSFFPSKNLGAFGDAGMISTNDDQMAYLVRMLLKHGGKDKYNVDHIGYNARIDTLQAAILVAKLNYIDEFNCKRQRIARTYIEGLNGMDDLVLPFAHNSHVFHQFTIRVLNGQREALQQHLRKVGIDSMVYYPVPLHNVKVFQDGRSISAEHLIEAEKACYAVLSLPIGPFLSEEDNQYVLKQIISKQNQAARGKRKA
jgi:dTDP-4-amino-4,6-dideoxygalactose transaminase